MSNTKIGNSIKRKREKTEGQIHLDLVNQKHMLDRRDPLPVRIIQEDTPAVLFVRQSTKLCIAATKKVAINSINGITTDLDKSIEAILLQVWNNGYNSGLEHMDKMHQQ